MLIIIINYYCVLKLSLFLFMKNMPWIKYSWIIFRYLSAYLRSSHTPGYLNNSVEKLSVLIVAPRKFDFLKTNICPKNEALRANMQLSRTSNFYGLQNSRGDQNSQRLLHSKELGICWSFRHFYLENKQVWNFSSALNFKLFTLELGHCRLRIRFDWWVKTRNAG